MTPTQTKGTTIPVRRIKTRPERGLPLVTDAIREAVTILDRAKKTGAVEDWRIQLAFPGSDWPEFVVIVAESGTVVTADADQIALLF